MAFMEVSFRAVVLLNVSTGKVFLIKDAYTTKPAKRPACR
ncbi:hypothetical protein RLEG12_16410 [Rhizobium leguminosarum bv. trifolii CB782]|nr:hypothetical protein RLEG12_16410 [Rhizobium leguminosarum bv. trifolii CB782]